MRKAWALAAAAAAVTSAALAVPARASGAPLQWLHVGAGAGGHRVIEDSSGRTVILRGVNVVGIEDDYYTTASGAEPGPSPFWPTSTQAYDGACPADSHAAAEPPVCEVQAGAPEFSQSSAPGSGNDLAQIRALGFNVIRLPVSWSLLEPEPGVYSASYVARIAQVVGWAEQQGVYVILDMHQDAYSRFTPEQAPVSAAPLLGPSAESGNHADGAPPWAVVADGVPAEAVDGQPELNAYVAAAFDSFWLNRVPTDASGRPLPSGESPGPGLQDHYIGAVATLVKAFDRDPAVVGYELMNEPLPGTIAPGVFDQGYLFPFYRRVIDAVTGSSDGLVCPPGSSYVAACGYRSLGIDDRRQLFFVEPMAARNLTDFAVGLSAPFTSYPGIVYAPHVYTHVFTADTYVPGGAASGLYPPGYGFAFGTAQAEADAIHAALFVGEYGNAASEDGSILASETAAEDAAGVGATLWDWKANCAPGVSQAACDSGTWAVYEPDAAPLPAENLAPVASRVKYISRIYPRATAGTLLSFGYDPANGSFAMSAYDRRAVDPSDNRGLTVVYVPPGLGGKPAATGAATLVAVVAQPDGSRLVEVAPTGGGGYGVTVGGS